MNRFFISLAAVAFLFLCSCSDTVKESDVTVPSEYQNVATTDFDYATSVTPTITISYQNFGFGEGVTTSTYFELYTEYPLEGSDSSNYYYVKDSITPIYSGYTKKDGTWEGQVEIPSYATTIYAYAPYGPIEKVIESSVVEGTIAITDAASSSAVAATRGASLRAPMRVADATTDDDEDGAYGDGLHFSKMVNFTGIEGNNSYVDQFTAIPNNGMGSHPLAWKTWLGRYSNTCNTYLADKTSEGTGATKNSVELPGINWLNYMAAFDGDFTELCGGIDYANVFATEMDKNILAVTDYAELLELHGKVIDVDKTECDSKYWGSNQTITVTKDASLAVTFLASKSGTTAALGYYYYTGDEPTDIAQVQPILIFPNVQDGAWNVVGKKAGTVRGTNVQLYYYGEPGNMSKDQKTNIFPAGTKIGFMLSGRAFIDENYTDNTHNRWGYNKCWAQYSTTTKGLCYNLKGDYRTDGFSGAALYMPDDEHVMFSFEDGCDDRNCSDLIFALSSNPINVFEGVVKVDSVTTKKALSSDVYAFEDLYPSTGDYDMNDLMVQVDNIKQTSTYISSTVEVGEDDQTTTVNCLDAESFRFTTFENYASRNNGLGVEIVLGDNINKTNIKDITLTVDSTYVITEEDMYPTSTGFVYYITSKVHAATDACPYVLVQKLDDEGNITQPGHTVELTINYYSPEESSENMIDLSEVTVGQSSVKPFIYRWEDDNRQSTWEVHIPYEAPSPLATDYRTAYVSNDTYTYFQTEDDGSEPAEGKFYTRSTSESRYRPYPFAFKLSGVKVLNSNLYLMLLPKNESQTIDTLFPNFINWVVDHAGDNTGEYDNWYNE